MGPAAAEGQPVGLGDAAPEEVRSIRLAPYWPIHTPEERSGALAAPPSAAPPSADAAPPPSAAAHPAFAFSPNL
eukprot:6787019-Prymnesium_polylepis.2